MIDACSHCEALQTALDAANASIASLTAQLAKRDRKITKLTSQLKEVFKLSELQEKDLARYREMLELTRRNEPERVARDQLQLAFQQILAAQPELAQTAANDALIDDKDAAAALGRNAKPSSTKTRKRGHGRRGEIDLSKLPQKRIVLDPPEVMEADGDDYVLIGTETSSRLGFSPASYTHLLFVRNIYARRTDSQTADDGTESGSVITAPLPDSVWPRVMADTSVIAHIAVSKYGDTLPLNRQETISARQGFRLPRSTQCDWLVAGWKDAHLVVDAMFAEACRSAMSIATDATSAPVRAPGKCDKWSLFVFLADRDHVIFDYKKEHTTETIVSVLGGYRGYVIADGHAIYNALYNEHGMTETGLKLYTTYRSLIASCMLHAINPQLYLEQMLRLLPYWPKKRVIELSPRYWTETASGLNDERRRIITAPWDLDPSTLALPAQMPRKRTTSKAA